MKLKLAILALTLVTCTSAEAYRGGYYGGGYRGGYGGGCYGCGVGAAIIAVLLLAGRLQIHTLNHIMPSHITHLHLCMYSPPCMYSRCHNLVTMSKCLFLVVIVIKMYWCQINVIVNVAVHSSAYDRIRNL